MSRDRSGELPVSMGAVRVIHETKKAILVEIAAKEVWIPQAAVHDDSEVWKRGDKGKLVVCAWFAKARGWD